MQRQSVDSQPTASTSTMDESSHWLIKELLLLRQNISSAKNRAKLVFVSVEKELDGFVKFLENVIGHINTLTEKSASEEDTDLKDFAVYLQESVKRLQALMAEANKTGGSTKDIVHKLNSFIVSIPDFLEAIQRLDLGSYTQGMPKTFEEMHQAVAKKISSLIEQIAPRLLQIVVDHAETVMSDDSNRMQLFSQLDPFVRTVDLAFLGMIVSELSEVVILLDQLEIEYSLKEGSLLESVSLQIPFKHTEAGLMTLKGLCERVGRGYEMRMRSEGYLAVACVETFPYAAAKLRSREAQLKKLEQDEQRYKERQREWCERTRLDNLEMVKAQLVRYQAEKSNRKEKINILTILTGELERDGGDIAKLLDELLCDKSSSKKLIENSEHLRSLINDIRENLSTLQRRIKHADKKRQLLRDRLQGKIQSIKDQIVQHKIPIENRDSRIDTNKIMYALMTQANKSMRIIEELMSGSAHSSSVSIVDELQEYLSALETELSKAIDTQIFLRYFSTATGSTAASPSSGSAGPVLVTTIAEPSSWIEDLGNTFKLAKEFLARLKILQKEYEKCRQKARVRMSDETPESNILALINLVDQCTDNLAQLAKAIKLLLSNPIISGAAPDITRRLKSTVEALTVLANRVVTELPVVQHLQRHAGELASGLGGADRASYVMQKLQEFYQYASERFSLDPIDRNIVDISLGFLAQVNRDAMQELNEDKIAKSKLISFVVRHIFQLATILLNVTQVKDLLVTAAREETLATLQKVNLLFRDIYLLADKLETEFFLREGYITRLSLHGVSLHSLLERFHQAIEDSGYEFNPDERFPYLRAIQAQRDRILADDLLVTPTDERVSQSKVDEKNRAVAVEFLQRRIKETDAVLRRQEQQAATVSDMVAQPLQETSVAGAGVADMNETEERTSLLASSQHRGA